MDGYVDSSFVEESGNPGQEYYERFLYIQGLYQTQVKIDEEIQLISDEIKKIPKIPPNIDRWASSFSSKFKISDMNKIFKLNKRYGDLMEERKSNGSKIKIFAIDNIMDQINEAISK